MKHETQESIQQAIKSFPRRAKGLRKGDIEAIQKFCKKQGSSADLSTIFFATLAAESIGFRNGRNYQKRHSNKS